MKMRRKLLSLALALFICAVLALPAFAYTYPAGIDESLPRVIDNDMLFFPSEKAALEERIYALIEKYQTDIVILTETSIGGAEPYAYADDFFDYGGYGWRAEETDDITTGDGLILLLVNMKADRGRDIEISCKGTAMAAIGIVDDMLDNAIGLLIDKKFAAACERFLDDTERRLRAYAAGELRPTYGGEYTYVYDNDSDYDSYDSGGIAFNGGVFFLGLAAALIIAWAAVSSMKKQMNTARSKTAACDYMCGDSFRLTQQGDLFLYSNTTRTLRPQDDNNTRSGGGFGGGSSTHTSSSGQTHGGGRF